MTAVLTLEVQKRERSGTGAARATRNQELVPAVIYGGGAEPMNIAVERRALVKELNKGSFQSKLIELKLGNETIRVLSREVQFHPVTDIPQHADFMRVKKDEKVRVWIRMVFEGKEKSPGIKRGGILNVVRHQVEFYCLPDAIPQSISVDVSKLEIGHSVHINDVTLPGSITPAIRGRNFTVATIAGRTTETEADLAAPVVATMTTEVIGEVKDEEGEEGAAAAAGDDAKEGKKDKEAKKEPAADKKEKAAKKDK